MSLEKVIKKISLKYLMMVYSTVMIVVVVLALGGVLLFYHKQNEWSEFTLRTNSVAKKLSENLYVTILQENWEGLKKEIDLASKEYGAVSVRVFNTDYLVLASTGHQGPLLPPKFLKVLKNPIQVESLDLIEGMENPETKDSYIVGYLEITFSTLEMRYQVMDMVKTVILFTMIIIAVRLIFDFILTEKITAPLGKLAETSESIANGNLDQKIEIAGTREIAKLALSFNKMATSLFERDSLIKEKQAELENNIIGLDNANRELKKAREEVEEAHEKLTISYEKIKEVDQLKSEFIASMSHELRTPLNSIIGFSGIILKGLDGPITESQNSDLTIVYKSGKHLLGLINNILDLSKIEAGRMELYYEDTDIVELIQEVISVFSIKAKDKKVIISLENEDENLRARVDPVRMKQVLINVVDNALKCTFYGTVNLNLKKVGSDISFLKRKNIFRATNKRNSSSMDYSSMLAEEHFVVTVKDTGVGIKHEDIPGVFESFRQVRNPGLNKIEGSGLGLPIANEIVQLHRGELLVESGYGLGTTFYIIFPVNKKPIAEIKES